MADAADLKSVVRLLYDYESTLARGQRTWIAAAWRAMQTERLQVANHTYSIQFNEVEGRKRFD